VILISAVALTILIYFTVNSQFKRMARRKNTTGSLSTKKTQGTPESKKSAGETEPVMPEEPYFLLQSLAGSSQRGSEGSSSGSEIVSPRMTRSQKRKFVSDSDTVPPLLPTGSGDCMQSKKARSGESDNRECEVRAGADVIQLSEQSRPSCPYVDNGPAPRRIKRIDHKTESGSSKVASTAASEKVTNLSGSSASEDAAVRLDLETDDTFYDCVIPSSETCVDDFDDNSNMERRNGEPDLEHSEHEKSVNAETEGIENHEVDDANNTDKEVKDEAEVQVSPPAKTSMISKCCVV